MSEIEFSRIPEALKKTAKQLIQANDPKSKTNENWKIQVFQERKARMNK